MQACPDALIERCESRGIRLSVSDEGKLAFSAISGALDADLRAALGANKDAIIRRLTGRTDMPLNALQRAYLAGQASDDLELGGIAPVYYLELSGPAPDPARLQAALAAMIDDHPVLGMAIANDKDGQPILHWAERGVPDIALVPCDHPTDRARLREDMLSNPHGMTRWPLFDIRVSRCGDTPDHLHLAFDLTLLDAHSGARFIRDLLARSGGATGQKPAVTACELRRLETGDPDHKAWWHARLDDLPRTPALPLYRPIGDVSRPRYARCDGTVTPGDWGRFGAMARSYGLTPSAAVSAIFAETMGAWSGRNDPCLLCLTLFQRAGDHPDRDAVLGDFTNLLPLASPTHAENLRDLMMTTQQALWDGVAHMGCSGVEVLAALARHRRQAGRAIAPVVFTSLLGRAGEEELSLIPPGWHQEAAISHTPQVAIDCQVYQDDGALRLSWDYVVDLFHADQVHAAFRAFQNRIIDLADTADWGRVPCQGPLFDIGMDSPRLGMAGDDGLPGRPQTALTPDQIAACWAEVLPGFGGARDISFFEAGGSSLLAVRLQAALGHAAGSNIPIHVIFDNPTIMAQSRALGANMTPPSETAPKRQFGAMAARRGTRGGNTK